MNQGGAVGNANCITTENIVHVIVVSRLRTLVKSYVGTMLEVKGYKLPVYLYIIYYKV